MFLRLILLLLLGLIALRTATAALDEPTELRDLHYGEALYQLYQQNYFHAIVRLLSAKKQGYMEEYGDEPDLLLGGLYLAYGMPDEAESLFQWVLNRSASPQIHDKAWLQLAKTRYRRDQQAAAANAISQIGDALPKAAATERQVFQGLINLEQSDNDRALQSLADLPRKGEWSRYGRYNQAIALLRMNQVEAGLKILKELGSAKADSAEMKALRDRANLIRGYLLLEVKQPADAKAALEQIRLSSLATNQALLGVGWASLLQDDPQGALAPWQELASRDARDPAVLEVMLAIPYALSQLEADDQSLHYYREGIDRFSQELSRLDQAIAAIQRGELLVSLQDTEDQAEGAENQLVSLLPLLLTENNFQERLQDYRDLVFLQANLQQWSEKISDYRDMLAVRQAAYEEKLSRLEASLTADDLNTLTTERDRLQALIERANSPDEPTFVLATSQEKALLKRFDKIDRLMEQIGNRVNLEAHRFSADLLRGTLIWRTVTEHPARRWEITKKLNDLNQTLAQAEAQQVALKQVHQQTQGGFKGFKHEIEALERRIPGLLTEVNQARSTQALILQQMAIRVLERRKTLINNYLIQARFGVASLLDRNSPAGGDTQ